MDRVAVDWPHRLLVATHTGMRLVLVLVLMLMLVIVLDPKKTSIMSTIMSTSTKGSHL